MSNPSSSSSIENLTLLFTNLLKYKQKYEDAEFLFDNRIPISSVKRIISVERLTKDADLIEEDYNYYLQNIVLVYEDNKRRIHIAIPPNIIPNDKKETLANIKKVVITDKIKMIKQIIQEAVMKKKLDNYIAVSPFVTQLPNGEIIYYTDKITVSDNLFPVIGFFYVNGDIYTNDPEVLKFAARYIIELNGIKVNSLKELIQMFIKLMDKFYITGDTLANFRDNDKIEFGETCLTPLYPEDVIIYTSNFEAEIGCGLRLKKGIIAFSYEWVAASPDVWSALT
jgi:hypothetical protein